MKSYLNVLIAVLGLTLITSVSEAQFDPSADPFGTAHQAQPGSPPGTAEVTGLPSVDTNCCQEKLSGVPIKGKVAAPSLGSPQTPAGDEEQAGTR